MQKESRSGGGYDDRPYVHTKYEHFEGVSVKEAAQVGLDNDNDGYHMHITWVSCAHHMSITYGYGMTLGGCDDHTYIHTTMSSLKESAFERLHK